MCASDTDYTPMAIKQAPLKVSRVRRPDNPRRRSSRHTRLNLKIDIPPRTTQRAPRMLVAVRHLHPDATGHRKDFPMRGRLKLF